jgi:hypothetical protein
MLLRSMEELSVGNILSDVSISLLVHPEERLSINDRPDVLPLRANVVYLHPDHY